MKQLWFLIGLLLLVGCGQESKDNKATIQIAFDYTGDSAFDEQVEIGDIKNIGVNTPGNWGVGDPTNIYQFNCFGVMVAIPGEAPNACNSLNGQTVARPHFVAGYMPLNGVVNIEVDSGPARTFWVVGVKRSDGTCPSILSFNDTEKNKMSAPFILGKKTQDLAPGLNVIDINASYSQRVKFENCNGPLFNWGSGGQLANIEPGQLGFWPMEEAGGNRNDQVGPTSTPITVSSGSVESSNDSIFGRSVDFASASPSNAHLTIATESEVDPGGKSAFTISTWIKFTSDPSSNTFYVARLNNSTPTTFKLYYDGSGSRFTFQVFDNGTNPTVSSSAFSTGELTGGSWFHLVGTYKAGVGITLTVNGVVTSAPTIGTIINDIASSTFSFGTNGSSLPLPGLMDNLRIWHRTLSPQEISFIYQHKL